MANPENPYTMGGFLRSKLQSNEQSIKQTPNLSEQQSIVPSTELIDSGHHDEPSALGLIGASFSTYLKLLPQLPGAVISKTQGKGLPSAYSSQLEKLDQKLNQADPNRPLVQGLKKLWNTPEPPKQDQLNTTEQIESEQLTQRPKLKLGLETDEERLARLTSEKRGDFDATPPVAPEVLKKDRGYNQIGFNSLYMPNAEVKANIQNPLNENNTQ
ncbi:MAG TPA: hypothetical protein PK833_03445, partial [Vicingus sp.]|nr:hypothetical protein [Vicingus sp.]